MDSIKYKNHKLEYKKNIINSVKLVGLSCFLILASLIIIVLIPNEYDIINKIVSPVGILITITIYYMNIWLIKKDFDNFKSIFVNFLNTIGLYNILIISNISSSIFEIEDLSSDYLISNVFLFYLSFLIVSFEYNYERKIFFAIDFFYGLKEVLIKNKLLGIIIIILIIIVTGKYIENKVIIETLNFLGIFLVITSLPLITVNIDYEERYIKTKKIFMKPTNFFFKFTNWIFEILKTERIPEYSLLGKKGEIKIISLFLFVFTKFIILFFLWHLYKTNFYYVIYQVENKGYCKENKYINDKTAIVKLKNENVLIGFKNENFFREAECIKNLKKIEFKD